MAEYEPGDALVKRHVFAPGLDEPLVTYAGGVKSFHVADPGSTPGQAERGSTVAETDGAGVATLTFGYGPHGEPDARGLPSRFAFTGAPILAPLALTQMRARTYSHNLGRFLQPDPIGQAGGINLYDYAAGDPVNRWDPIGLSGCGTRIIGHDAAFCTTTYFQNGGRGSRDGIIADSGGYWVQVPTVALEGVTRNPWRFVASPSIGFLFAYSGGFATIGGQGNRADGGGGESTEQKKRIDCKSSLVGAGIDFKLFGSAFQIAGVSGMVAAGVTALSPIAPAAPGIFSMSAGFYLTGSILSASGDLMLSTAGSSKSGANLISDAAGHLMTHGIPAPAKVGIEVLKSVIFDEFVSDDCP